MTPRVLPIGLLVLATAALILFMCNGHDDPETGEAPSTFPPGGASMVAEMYMHGTSEERLWAAYGLLSAPAEQRRRALAEVGYFLRKERSASKEEDADERPPPSSRHAVRIHLRCVRTTERGLADLGIALTQVLASSPPYDSNVLHAGTPLYASLNQEQHQALDREIAAGRMPQIGEDRALVDNLAGTRMIAAARPASTARSAAWRPVSGAAVHLSPVVSADLRSASLRMAVRIALVEPLANPPKPSVYVDFDAPTPTLAVRHMPDRVVSPWPGQTLLVLARQPVFGDWPAGEELAVLITVEIVPSRDR